MNNITFTALLPYGIVFATALVVLLLDLFERIKKEALLYVAYLGIGVAMGALMVQFSEPRAEVLSGALVVDALSRLVGMVILGATMLTCLASHEQVLRAQIRMGEYYGLLLCAAGGLMLLPAAGEFITLFLAIELVSIALYILVGIVRRQERANEASVKYFLMGAFATGFLLYGMAFIYGATGTLSIGALSQSVQSGVLLAIGLVLFLIGIVFKIGGAPFHMWVPDVYEGALTPLTAFMSVAVKIGAFAALLRVFGALVAHVASYTLLLELVAIVTMIVGNIFAVTQRSVKRMLAYSSISHTGYALIGMAVLQKESASAAASSVLFYLVAYTFMTLGAFLFISYLRRGEKEAESYDDFAGLARSKPWAAAFMTVLMISLAGIPPTAGFVGKFYIFKTAIDYHFYALVLVGVLTTVISLYYYLKVVVMMYMNEPTQTSVGQDDRLSQNVGVAIAVAVLFTLLLGFAPSLYVSIIDQCVPF